MTAPVAGTSGARAAPPRPQPLTGMALQQHAAWRSLLGSFVRGWRTPDRRIRRNYGGPRIH